MLSEESQNIIVASEHENQQLANKIRKNKSFKLFNFYTKNIETIFRGQIKATIHIGFSTYMAN